MQNPHAESQGKYQPTPGPRNSGQADQELDIRPPAPNVRRTAPLE
jgi:hypothetical protein